MTYIYIYHITGFYFHFCWGGSGLVEEEVGQEINQAILPGPKMLLHLPHDFQPHLQLKSNYNTKKIKLEINQDHLTFTYKNNFLCQYLYCNVYLPPFGQFLKN